MDLLVDGLKGKKLTSNELTLIEWARSALKEQNFSITEQMGQRTFTHIVAAIVWVREDGIGIDFKSYVPGVEGQAFLGPEAPLTEDLFVGDTFKPEFLARIQQSFDNYVTHCKQSRKESGVEKKNRRR